MTTNQIKLTITDIKHYQCNAEVFAKDINGTTYNFSVDYTSAEINSRRYTLSSKMNRKILEYIKFYNFTYKIVCPKEFLN